MLIAIDGYEANQTQRVGIGRYAFEIISGIFEILNTRYKDQSSKEIIFIIYLPNDPLPDLPQDKEWWKYKVIKPNKFWTFVGLPLALAVTKQKPDVIFSPTHYAPRFNRVPSVIAIMDLSYLKFPLMFKSEDLYKLRRWTKYSISRAARILTISEASKSDIISEYKVDPEKVTVIYPGLTMKSKSKVLNKYEIGKNYIISVGTLQPRKNYIMLIKAFSLLLKELKGCFTDLQLIIAGKKGWLYDDILTAPEKFGVKEQVKFLGFVANNDLPGLYEEALCFALPSLYEGFGLPVLEAMSCGCQVVVSNNSSLPEIAGKAGIYIKPDDHHSIASGLRQAVLEKDTAKGKERIRIGKVLAKKFTWEEAAKKTLEVLEDVGRKNLKSNF